jgi:hypothetical protein
MMIAGRGCKIIGFNWFFGQNHMDSVAQLGQAAIEIVLAGAFSMANASDWSRTGRLIR